jgi:hypothetical protein
MTAKTGIINIRPSSPEYFPSILNLASGSYSYRHTEMSVFRKFHLFSHPMTTKIVSYLFFTALHGWSSHVKRVAPLKRQRKLTKREGSYYLHPPHFQCCQYHF